MDSEPNNPAAQAAMESRLRDADNRAYVAERLLTLLCVRLEQEGKLWRYGGKQIYEWFNRKGGTMSKTCKLIQDVDYGNGYWLRPKGTVVKWDKEDDTFFHVEIGHGEWIKLEKGVQAE